MTPAASTGASRRTMPNAPSRGLAVRIGTDEPSQPIDEGVQREPEGERHELALEALGEQLRVVDQAAQRLA